MTARPVAVRVKTCTQCTLSFAMGKIDARHESVEESDTRQLNPRVTPVQGVVNERTGLHISSPEKSRRMTW